MNSNMISETTTKSPALPKREAHRHISIDDFIEHMGAFGVAAEGDDLEPQVLDGNIVVFHPHGFGDWLEDGDPVYVVPEGQKFEEGFISRVFRAGMGGMILLKGNIPGGEAALVLMPEQESWIKGMFLEVRRAGNVRMVDRRYDWTECQRHYQQSKLGITWRMEREEIAKAEAASKYTKNSEPSPTPTNDTTDITPGDEAKDADKMQASEGGGKKLQQNTDPRNAKRRTPGDED